MGRAWRGGCQMAVKTKRWAEKFERACQNTPQVVAIEGKLRKTWGTGTCVIPSPREIEGLMRKVPKGKLTTINELRQLLAKKHHATMACPMTTGIFSNITAHLAEENRAKGKTRIPPYWRVLKSGGEVNPKYPGGVDTQTMFLTQQSWIRFCKSGLSTKKHR